MQDIINARPQTTALLLLQMGERFVATYGDGLPEHFRSPAWNYTITNNTIIIGTLKAVWELPAEAVGV